MLEGAGKWQCSADGECNQRRVHKVAVRDALDAWTCDCGVHAAPSRGMAIHYLVVRNKSMLRSTTCASDGLMENHWHGLETGVWVYIELLRRVPMGDYVERL